MIFLFILLLYRYQSTSNQYPMLVSTHADINLKLVWEVRKIIRFWASFKTWAVYMLNLWPQAFPGYLCYNFTSSAFSHWGYMLALRVSLDSLEPIIDGLTHCLIYQPQHSSRVLPLIPIPSGHINPWFTNTLPSTSDR